MIGARPGSREKCGLPSGCTSPIERSTRVEGTSRSAMPREISIRPGAPRTIFGWFAPRTATSAHASSSTPFSTSASALRSFSIMLGRTSASWKFWVPRVRASTSTRSPPTASTSDFRSGMVATTRSFRAAWALGTSRVSARSSVTAANELERRMSRLPILERVGGMGAEDERALEEDLVHLPRASPVEVEAVAMVAVGVLVDEAEAQEFRRPEGHVGLDRPLAPGTVGELRPVVADASRPPPPRLHLAPEVPAEAVALALVERIGRSVTVRVELGMDPADRVDGLAGEREQGMQPALRPVLVARLPAEERVASRLARLAARDRHAELDRRGVAELEERAQAPREHRDPEGAAAEGRLVVAVEDADQPLQVEG